MSFKKVFSFSEKADFHHCFQLILISTLLYFLNRWILSSYFGIARKMAKDGKKDGKKYEDI